MDVEPRGRSASGGRYTNRDSIGGGGGDGSGGDPVEEEPALPVVLHFLFRRLNLLAQLRGLAQLRWFDICKRDCFNVDRSPSSSGARCCNRARRYIANACSI